MHRWIYLLVAGGGAIGSVARFWLSEIVGRRWGDGFPTGTLAVNVVGCLVIGFFATISGPDGRWLLRPEWRLAFMSGVCGGFTTFSAFGLQTLDLGLHGQWFRAGANVMLSVLLCLLAVWIGHITATAWNR